VPQPAVIPAAVSHTRATGKRSRSFLFLDSDRVNPSRQPKLINWLLFLEKIRRRFCPSFATSSFMIADLHPIW
jgi:hypothetical protein